MTHYLTAEEVLVIHALLIEEIGGADGVRDVHLLESLIERPKASFGGADLHIGLSTKAAVFCEALVNYHIFIDGNKRTALVSLARFLEINGKRLTASNEEAVETMLAIAEKRTDSARLSAWIEKYSA